MMRRVAFVFCAVLSGAFGCESKVAPLSTPSASCKDYAASLVVKDGQRLLQIRLPDGRSVIVNLDVLPPSPSAPIDYIMCPCEYDECKAMCLKVAPELVAPGKACLVPPRSHATPGAASHPDTGTHPDGTSRSPVAPTRP
jgi:hypothetical protein